jgi:hypothetical protein
MGKGSLRWAGDSEALGSAEEDNDGVDKRSLVAVLESKKECRGR